MASNITASANDLTFTNQAESLKFYLEKGNVIVGVQYQTYTLTPREIVFLIAYLQNIVKHG